MVSVRRDTRAECLGDFTLVSLDSGKVTRFYRVSRWLASGNLLPNHTRFNLAERGGQRHCRLRGERRPPHHGHAAAAHRLARHLGRVPRVCRRRRRPRTHGTHGEHGGTPSPRPATLSVCPTRASLLQGRVRLRRSRVSVTPTFSPHPISGWRLRCADLLRRLPGAAWLQAGHRQSHRHHNFHRLRVRLLRAGPSYAGRAMPARGAGAAARTVRGTCIRRTATHATGEGHTHWHACGEGKRARGGARNPLQKSSSLLSP
eukprot:scaffold69321_cov73-Phaeocystis_antarctica.AAC.1